METADKQNMQTLNIDETLYQTTLTKKYEKRTSWTPVNHNEVRSVIPGLIKKVMVKDAQKVKQGDVLLILEAMKMDNRILATHDCTITKIHIKEGEKIPKGFLMIEIT